MKAEELRKLFNDTFVTEVWPKTYVVDAETYGYCCQAIFDWLHKHTSPIEVFEEAGIAIHDISLGTKNNGIMFKNVELILERK